MDRILNQLDQFFNKQKESEQKLMFFLPLLLFGFISYYFVYPISDQALRHALSTNKNLKLEIVNTKRNNTILMSNNAQIKRTLKVAEEKLKELRKSKEEIQKLVDRLSFLKFNLDKWGKLYNDIPSIAKKYHLTILKLDNTLSLEPNNKLIQKNMDILINVSGRFVDFIKFIHYFEAKKELVKITSIKIEKNKMLLRISIYGAKL